MRATVRLDEFEAIHSGEVRAEPQLWTVFWKLDGDTFARVLKRELEQGKLRPERIRNRGLSLDAVEAAGEPELVYRVPIQKGAFTGVSTGDVVELGHTWTTELDGRGLLAPGQSRIGLTVVMWELDTVGGASNEDHYAELEQQVRRRLYRAVVQAVEDQRFDGGPFQLPASVLPEAPEQDSMRDHWKKYFRGRLLKDDYVGSAVAHWTAAELASRPTGNRLFLPTEGSEEGSWRLHFGAEVAK